MTRAAIQEESRREQSKSERRVRIVQAARELIRETGDTDLSMRTLAKRAGVSLGTPYNLFGSKRAVVMAVLDDERDFVARLTQAPAATALDQIFEAHELAVSYFVNDPAFYRPLWKTLLNPEMQDETGLATPERQAMTRAAWRRLIEAAQKEGSLTRDVSAEHLERTLSYAGLGVMLSWASGALETGTLKPAGGLAYALALSGIATDAGRARLVPRVKDYTAQLDAAS